MTQSHKQPPPPAAIVIFGANGDLTKRLVVPALYNLSRSGLLPPRLALVGVDHNDKSSEEYNIAVLLLQHAPRRIHAFIASRQGPIFRKQRMLWSIDTLATP